MLGGVRSFSKTAGALGDFTGPTQRFTPCRLWVLRPTMDLTEALTVVSSSA